MRKVIVLDFLTLDGVVEDTGWTFQFAGEEQPRYKLDELAASDALLLGRTTYKEFAATWPNMMEQYECHRWVERQEFAEMMNGYPKHVASKTLQESLEWNNSTLVKGNVAEEVSRIKRQPGKDILVFGSGDLVNTLMKHGFIDEYRLMVFPIVVGSGKRLFGDGLDTTILELVDTKVFDSGVVDLAYRPTEQ